MKLIYVTSKHFKKIKVSVRNNKNNTFIVGTFFKQSTAEEQGRKRLDKMIEDPTPEFKKFISEDGDCEHIHITHISGMRNTCADCGAFMMYDYRF